MGKRYLPVIAAALLSLACAAAVPREAAAPATAQFTSDRMTVVTRGTGPDIILVPGLASHRDVWSAVADSLAGRYRLHLVQLNGFAGLPPGANATGPVSAPVAEEIARYIRETNIDRPAIIGHSMGGTIAMMLAARHTGAVGRVMVVDMFPYLGAIFARPGATHDELVYTADQFRAQILADTAGAPDGVLEQMFPGMTRVESMRPMLLEGVRTTHRATAANAFHELIVADVRPELAKITVPMSVLYVMPPELQMTAEQFDQAVRSSFTAVPHARVVRVADSNHFIQFDQPGRFVSEVDMLMRAPARRP